MFFQKTFHVHLSLDDTRRQLGMLAKYRHRIAGLRKVVVTADGVMQFDCSVTPKLDLHAVLVEVPADGEDELLFRSSVGNVEVAGAMSLVSIRPELTEVTLALDYSLTGWTNRFLDFCTHRVERYLEASLRSVIGALHGDFPSAYRRAAQGFIEPQPEWVS